MRLVTYRAARGWQTGVLVGELVVDAEAVLGRDKPTSNGATSLCTRELLAASESRWRDTSTAAADAAQTGSAVVGALADVELGPPVPDPEKIFCLGLNYRDHSAETALPVESVPTIFAKFRNALAGSRSPIVLPSTSSKVDFEGELAVVIGRRGKHIPRDRALSYVGGYMPFNDVSARDLQMATSQWTAGKVADTFAPCGPALVLCDEVADPHALRIATRVNGETLQSASTADMIFGVAETVSYLSQLVTLEVGDIISTGTPAGVGYTRDPPIFLAAGDVVEVEIEGLGVLQNPVVAPDAPTPTGSRTGEDARAGA